ncbi:unnamed protein product [Adineta ricciae]|uniref:Uncharacterized protein n=1 Tax=Adineta ricciae TaxID=249248 RepID=A0A815K6G6_ADIRI|nr:unnamed protein product [Adineta ricciae]
MSYYFTWFLRLQFMYVWTFILCVALWFSPKRIYMTIEDIITKLTSGEINLSPILHSPYESTLETQCSLSKVTFIDNINSYTHMNDINIILSFVSLVLICLIQSLLWNVSSDHLKNSYRWFCWGRRILVLFLSSSILNQVVCATTCRPVEIFYDPRHILMFSLHLFNFFVCNGFSFFLGVKFSSIRPEHRRSTS